MSSSVKMEEDVVKLNQKWRALKAVASRTVDDEGKVQISMSVSLMGIELSVDEVSKLMDALPAAVQRAGAMAAKLELDDKMTRVQLGDRMVPYEPPVVTPVGNMNDRLSEVCATGFPFSAAATGAALDHDKDRYRTKEPTLDHSEVLVVVSGQEVAMYYTSSDLLCDVRERVLQKTGNGGLLHSDWEFRDEAGDLLSMERNVSRMNPAPSKLYLGPKAGAGGNVTAEV